MALRDPRILENTLAEAERNIVRDLSRRVHERFENRLAHFALFGSRARGDATPESDIDVLVALQVAPEELLAEERAIWQIATEAMSAHGYAPLSIVVLTAEQFQELLTRERRFALDVTREGIAL